MNKEKFKSYLYREMPIWLKAGLLEDKSVKAIEEYYGPVSKKTGFEVFFAVLTLVGSLCIGLGIILLFAYNWTQFSQLQKTLLSFLPLLGSWTSIFILLSKKKRISSLCESAAIFNFLAIGSAIALVSQTYHLSGTMDRFTVVWALASLPVVYLLNSTLNAVLYLVTITSWAGFAQSSGGHAVLFWPLLLLVLPFYVQKIKNYGESIKQSWLSMTLIVCLTVAIGVTLEKALPGLWIVIYSCFFAVIFVGLRLFDFDRELWAVPLKYYSHLGLVVLAYILSFSWVWDEIGWCYYRNYGKFHGVAAIVDYLICIALLIGVIFLLIKSLKRKSTFDVMLSSLGLISAVTYIMDIYNLPEFILLMIFNFYFLSLGILTIIHGFKETKLFDINLGIAMTALMLYTRFVDFDMDILPRAIAFIVIGIIFIVVNKVLHARFKQEAQNA